MGHKMCDSLTELQMAANTCVAFATKNIQLNILNEFDLNFNDFTEGIQIIWIKLLKSHEMISTQKISY